MICPRCGAVSSTSQCPQCGADMVHSLPKGKRKYLFTAGGKTRFLAITAYLLTVACLISLAFSYYAAQKTPPTELPIYRVAEEAIPEMKELGVSESLPPREDLAALAEEGREYLEENRDRLNAQQLALFEEAFAVLDTAVEDGYTLEVLDRTLSLVSAVQTVELPEAVLSVIPDYTQILDQIPAETFSVITAVLHYALLLPIFLCALLCLLGGGLHVRGFVILSLICSFFYTLLLCSTFVVILTAVAHTALIVVQSLLYHRYGDYCRGLCN